jgi:hypothetical protein
MASLELDSSSLGLGLPPVALAGDPDSVVAAKTVRAVKALRIETCRRRGLV